MRSRCASLQRAVAQVVDSALVLDGIAHGNGTVAAGAGRSSKASTSDSWIGVLVGRTQQGARRCDVNIAIGRTRLRYRASGVSQFSSAQLGRAIAVVGEVHAAVEMRFARRQLCDAISPQNAGGIASSRNVPRWRRSRRRDPAPMALRSAVGASMCSRSGSVNA